MGGSSRSHRRGRFYKRPTVWRRFGKCIDTPMLPNGLGSIGVSIPLAKRNLSATGYSIRIDGAGFWKATANVEHKVQPFVVYETVNGVKKVYKKAATNNFFRLSLGKRKVG